MVTILETIEADQNLKELVAMISISTKEPDGVNKMLPKRSKG
jgi:hypothetical protein